ncbi:hypothetical protein [Novosphingobium sp. CECT 9465]|uniref:hypothetical protein n=1 Tax=Novosphingobium sp. CECT 9465 TaxID=2829794 RepID=UPI001E463094|nr:hypothetical protein [Novosphingobium sp. CECT 9465]CAH0497788.1 hypothetical protein NVSP9465_02858 [Novosphingobium sp. CECT 9465]
MKYFEIFGEGGYHSAFLTTYAFGAQAFEDVPFPKLRGAGCRNIAVLADRQMANQSFADFGAPRFAGSSYHIVKADAPGAFHPKITMLVGATKGRLLVGSGNLTALGLGGNRELIADIRFNPNEPDHAPIFADALAYIRSYVPPQDQWFSTALSRALRLSPWLGVEGTPIIRDAGGEAQIGFLRDWQDSNILDQIVTCVGGDIIERLVVLSPFWDTKLSGLSRLRSAFGEPPTDLLIDNETVGFPVDELRNHSDVRLFDTESVSAGRFVHAKLILAIGKSWDHVISGSMNCTFPAMFGPSSPAGNAEAGFYKRVGRGTALSGLGLANYSEAPLEPSTISPMAISTAPGTGPVAQIDGGSLMLAASAISWTPPGKWSGTPVMLKLFDREDQSVAQIQGLATTGVQHWHLDMGEQRPRYGVVVMDEDSISAPVPITDVDVLAVATLPPQGGRRRKLIDHLVDAMDEDLSLIETLSQLEAIEFEEGQSRPGIRSSGADADGASKESGTREYGVLSYEDFVRARTEALTASDGARGFLTGRQDSAASMVSACLNRLIGLVGPDLGDVEDREIQAQSAIDFRTTEPAAAADVEQPTGRSDIPGRPRGQFGQTLATAKKFQEAVTAFEARCKVLSGKPITTSEIVRLRGLLQIILSHAQPVRGNCLAAQILPVYNSSGHDWPRLIGRLLVQHFSTSRALQSLHLEQDESEQHRVVEYLALANWSARAAQAAVKSTVRASQLQGPLDRLLASLQSQTQAVLAAVPGDRTYFDQVTSKLDDRFQSRLGLPA